MSTGVGDANAVSAGGNANAAGTGVGNAVAQNGSATATGVGNAQATSLNPGDVFEVPVPTGCNQCFC